LQKNISVAAIALAWLRAQETVSAPITSATKLEQIKGSMPLIDLSAFETAELLT